MRLHPFSVCPWRASSKGFRSLLRWKTQSGLRPGLPPKRTGCGVSVGPRTSPPRGPSGFPLCGQPHQGHTDHVTVRKAPPGSDLTVCVHRLPLLSAVPIVPLVLFSSYPTGLLCSHLRAAAGGTHSLCVWKRLPSRGTGVCSSCFREKSGSISERDVFGGSMSVLSGCFENFLLDVIQSCCDVS